MGSLSSVQYHQIEWCKIENIINIFIYTLVSFLFILNYEISEPSIGNRFSFFDKKLRNGISRIDDAFSLLHGGISTRRKLWHVPTMSGDVLSDTTHPVTDGVPRPKHVLFSLF